MRIIRFLGSDGRAHHGEQRENGSASLLLDPQGVLGPVGATSKRGLFRGRHVLVADDDEKMREMIATVLERVGCRCTQCSDGGEAMAALQRGIDLDMMVTDIVMPHHNGYELFSAARERSEDMPIVLVTGFGYDPSHSLVRATEEGMVAVLYKPFAPQRLLDELSEAIRLTHATPAEALLPSNGIVDIERELAPLIPTNIICVGRNYPVPGAGRTADDEVRDHSEEHLEVFTKPTTTVQDPWAPIRIPDCGGVDPLIDVEGELAIVIGATARNLAPADALSVVLGYTAANDVTARHWQTRTGPPIWMRGKGFDTFCPLGPSVVTTEEIPDPNALDVRTAINGEVVRDGNTRDMLRSVETLISDLSKRMTLMPGTVILTGAPPRLHPGPTPTALQPGDEVTVEIEGIGRLVNTIEMA